MTLRHRIAIEGGSRELEEALDWAARHAFHDLDFNADVEPNHLDRGSQDGARHLRAPPYPSRAANAVRRQRRRVLAVRRASRPGTLVNAGNVERYTRMALRVVMISCFPWIQAGTNEVVERAAAGVRG